MTQEQLSWNSGFIPSRNLIYVGPNCPQGQPTPKSTGNRGYFLGDNGARPWNFHSLPTTAKVKNVCSYTTT